MTNIVVKDLVQTTLAAPCGTTDVTLSVNAATTPFLTVPNPGSGGIGYLVIADSLTNPTKIEIISYTGYSSGSVTGVTRGLSGTTAQSFIIGAAVYMAPISLNTSVPLWVKNISTGNISIVGSKVGIGTATPVKDLDVVGDTAISGDVSAATGHISDLHSTTVETTGDVTVGGNTNTTGNSVTTGFASAAALHLPSSIALSSYKIGTWVPTLIGSSAAGSGTYSVQTGQIINIGRLTILQFVINVTWPVTAPAGTLIISGYPSIGTTPGFVGSFARVTGIQGYKGLTFVDTSDPVFNSVALHPITITNGTNQGINISRSVLIHDEAASPKDSSNYVAAIDATYIIDPTVGVDLIGTLMFVSNTEA